MGSAWRNDSFEYDEHYVVRPGRAGDDAGGHARCWDGYIPDYFGQEVFRGFMSWGPWGKNGVFYEPVSLVHELWEQGAEYAWLVPA
jgi:hypothetical protein